MAKPEMVIEREAEDYVRLEEGDNIAFVRNSEGCGVFKYKKSSTSKYNNGYIAVVLKKDEQIPFVLSMSSIIAPYGCKALFVESENKNLNKLFDKCVKRTYANLVDSGTIVTVNAVESVTFKTKAGKTIDWYEYELLATKKTFKSSTELIEELDAFCVEYIEKQNKKLQE